MITLVNQDVVTLPEENTIRLIPLTQGKSAIVDAADYEWLNQWRWHATKIRCSTRSLWYAVRTIKVHGRSEKVLMHRALLGSRCLERTDHKDGNGLNNSRANIRPATNSQNLHNQGANRRNKSGIKGVHFYPRTNKWMARICVGWRRIHLGYFQTKEEAGDAYRLASESMCGEFSRNSGF